MLPLQWVGVGSMILVNRMGGERLILVGLGLKGQPWGGGLNALLPFYPFTLYPFTPVRVYRGPNKVEQFLPGFGSKVLGR